MAKKEGIEGLFDHYRIQAVTDFARIGIRVMELKKKVRDPLLDEILEIATSDNKFFHEVRRSCDFSADALELLGSR